MRGYALITLNMIDYAGIYLKKQRSEYVRIQVGGGEVGVFVELDHFDKNYVKKSRKKRPKEKYVGVFSPRYS